MQSPSNRNGGGAASRRGLLRAGLAFGAAGAAGLIVPGRAAAGPAPVHAPRAAGNPALDALAAQDLGNGGAGPVPIPWLDKNGSHNQPPGPGVEPSSIFDFKGRVARANDFSGTGTAGDGEPLSFGTKSTDFSFMKGEYFAGRQARQGMFGHL